MDGTKKQAEQETHPFPIENYLFPAVVVREDLSLIARNRLAKKLLPAPWKLRQYLKHMEGGGSEERWLLSEWEDVRWFVGVIRRDDFRLLVFLENLFPLYEPLARRLFEEEDDLLEEMLNTNRDAASGPELRESLCARVAARTFRLRRQIGLCRSLFSISEKSRRRDVKMDPTVCCVTRLAAILEQKLKQYRLDLAYVRRENYSAFVSPWALLAVMINLVQFAAVYEGDERVELLLEQRGRTLWMKLSYAGRQGSGWKSTGRRSASR